MASSTANEVALHARPALPPPSASRSATSLTVTLPYRSLQPGEVFKVTVTASVPRSTPLTAFSVPLLFDSKLLQHVQTDFSALWLAPSNVRASGKKYKDGWIHIVIDQQPAASHVRARKWQPLFNTDDCSGTYINPLSVCCRLSARASQVQRLYQQPAVAEGLFQGSRHRPSDVQRHLRTCSRRLFPV